MMASQSCLKLLENMASDVYSSETLEEAKITVSNHILAYVEFMEDMLKEEV